MKAWVQPRRDWTVVLRRRPVRMVEGRAEGGYTEDFEVVCCECGDDPYLDYREVSPELQRVRGPYPMPEGVTAYVEHVSRHPESAGNKQEGVRPDRMAWRYGK